MSIKKQNRRPQGIILPTGGVQSLLALLQGRYILLNSSCIRFFEGVKSLPLGKFKYMGVYFG